MKISVTVSSEKPAKAGHQQGIHSHIFKVYARGVHQREYMRSEHKAVDFDTKKRKQDQEEKFRFYV